MRTEKDEGGICLRVRQSRSGSHSSAEKWSKAVKYCVGRTTDPNTALRSQRRKIPSTHAGARERVKYCTREHIHQLKAYSCNCTLLCLYIIYVYKLLTGSICVCVFIHIYIQYMHAQTHTHTYTPLLFQGHALLPTLFSPKRTLYPLFSPRS